MKTNMRKRRRLPKPRASTKTTMTKTVTTTRQNRPTYILGEVVEIKYRRTTGKHRGQFKHVFKRGGQLAAGYDKQGRKVLFVQKPPK